jgi:hypothetical protein
MCLPMEKAELILRMLLEGNSVSSVLRLLNVHTGTILELSVKAGEKCERIMAEKIRDVEARDVECDELWSFIGKKQNASVLKTIQTLAIAIPTWRLRDTASWF